nr:hypothetical protein [uncultured Pedobacter sp.]
MKTFLKWTKRIGLGLVSLLILLLLIGFIFERISRNAAEKIKPDGQFVEVENHRLHYYKKGNGGPTVVFETAFDPAGHLQWYNIQQELPSSYTSPYISVQSPIDIKSLYLTDYKTASETLIVC